MGGAAGCPAAPGSPGGPVMAERTHQATIELKFFSNFRENIKIEIFKLLFAQYCIAKLKVISYDNTTLCKF